MGSLAAALHPWQLNLIFPDSSRFGLIQALVAKSSTVLPTNVPEEGCDQLLWCPGVQSLLNPQVLPEPRATPQPRGQSAQTDSGWDPKGGDIWQ